MKIIFLDIDGVLNTEETFEKKYLEFINNNQIICPIDEFRVEYLKRIIDEVGANIVLFSTWSGGFKKENNIIIPLSLRKNSYAEGLYNLFIKYNIKIHDKISKQESIMSNSDKLKLQLLEHNYVEEFIIIEDEPASLFESFKDNIIDVSKSGLSEEHISLAVNMLSSHKVLKLDFDNY